MEIKIIVLYAQYLQNTENIPPQVIKKVLKEINEINSEPLDGVRLIPNEQDICDIQALIDGPGKSFRYQK
jgi:ubiquitin-conjugating enzyme E2 S